MDGSKGVGRAMRETRDQMRDLQDQQKRLTAFRDLSSQSAQTREALRDKREELRQITHQLETTEGPTRRLEQQQDRARREVEKLTDQYRNQRDGVRELARELPPGIDGTRSFAEQNAALEAQIRATNERLEAQRSALGRLGEADVGGKFRNMTGEIRRFARNVTVAGGIAAGTVFGLASTTASLGDDVAKTADLMGVGTEQLQEMRYAAERAGLSNNALDSSMQRMVRRIGRAAQGGGAAAKAYEELGLSARELADMAPADALGVVADRLNQVENQTDKVAYASAIWGNNGEAMLNMIRGGSSALEDYYAQARAIGHVLEDGAVRAAEDFQDALLDNQLTMRGMRHTIGAELMPSVTDLMRLMTGWMQENRHHVQQFARDLGDGLKAAVPIVRDLVQGGWRLVSAIGTGVDRVASLVGGYDNLAMVVGGLFASKMLISVIAFVVSLVKAGSALVAFAKTLPALAGGMKVLSAAFAATPIGWLVAGIMALIYVGYLLWKNWGSLGEQFRGMWEDLKAAFGDGIGAVTKLLLDWSPFGAIYRVIVSALESLGIEVPEVMQTLGGWIVDGLAGGITDGFSVARQAIADLANSLMDWFKGVLGINSPSRVFAGFGVNIVEGIINGIGGMIGALRDTVVGLAGNIAGWMRDAISGAWDSGIELAQGFAGGVRDRAAAAVDSAGNLASETIDTVRGMFRINSPSRVFRDIGGGVAEGLTQGIQRSEDEPISQAMTMARRVRDMAGGLLIGTAAATPAIASPAINMPMPPAIGVEVDSRQPMASAAAAITVEGDSIEIHVHASPGMSEQELAAQIGRILDERDRQKASRLRSALYDTE
jgi:hypothetical protein